MKITSTAACSFVLGLAIHSAVMAQPGGEPPLQLGESVEIGAADNAGTISGTERFLRRNRSGRSFVGSDLRERRGFVGRQQARNTAQIRSAVTTTPVPPRPDVNQQLRQRGRRRGRNTIYRPRLVVDVDAEAATVIATDEPYAMLLSENLELVIARGLNESVQAHLEGQTVVLRGTVGSSHARALAEQIARLAPKVWDVRNELEVAAAPESEAASAGPDVAPTPTPTGAR